MLNQESLKAELSNTLYYRENALSGHLSTLDRYIDIKTLLGCYDRAECPLSDIDREIVIKHLVFGYTHQELAEDYNLSRPAIGGRINKALGVLQCTINNIANKN